MEVGVLKRCMCLPIPYSQSQPAELTDKLSGEKCDVGTLQSSVQLLKRQQFYASLHNNMGKPLREKW